MSFVSFSTDPNIMNAEQLNKLKESYTEMILDGMDMDTLVQFAFDSIMDNIKDWDEQDVKEEVLDLYDEEMWQDLSEVATSSEQWLLKKIVSLLIFFSTNSWRTLTLIW